MNFFDQVSSMIRAAGSLEDLGRGLARVLDTGHLGGFVLFGAPERCLVTVPYLPPEDSFRLRERFERSDWRRRPREAFLAAFSVLQVPTGEIGEGIEWTFLGTEEEPLGAFACVRDPTAPPASEQERKTIDFFFHLAGELALSRVRTGRSELEDRERDYLLGALNQIGGLMLERPERARLLPSLLKIALDVARTEVGSILLLSNGRFVTEVEWGLSGELFESIRFLPDDRGIIERIQETMLPVIVDDFSGPTVRLPPDFPVRISTMVSLPLLTGDQLTGILNLATGEDGREVLLSTVAALNTVASLIATAVENARLTETFMARAQRATQGLAEEQNLLRRVLANLREGVLVSDGAGALVMANPAAEEMLGLGAGASRRFPERNVITLRPFFTVLRDRWAANARTETFEHVLGVNPPAVLAVTISPLSQSEEGWSHVTVVRDVTAERTLATARRDGSSKIASEIERPVAAVRAALELVPPVAGVRYGSYERIARRGVERLAAIAEDLRDQGLLEEGRLKLEKSPVRLENLVAAAAADLREEFLEKRIAFRGPNPDANGLVLGDSLRLSRSVARLLSAALRFTPDDGWVHVDLSATGETCCLSIGFLQGPVTQEIEALLGPGAGGLYAEEGAIVAGAPGLAVVRQIVELHGGRLSLKIEERQEARLVLDLPAATAESGSAKAWQGAERTVEYEPFLER